MRLYLLQLGLVPDVGAAPLPGYLIQTDDGANVLVDWGYSRRIHGVREQVAAEVLAEYPDDPLVVFNAMVIRGLRDDPEDFLVNRLAVLGLTPRDTDYPVCTQFDADHAGNHDLFPARRTRGAAAALQKRAPIRASGSLTAGTRPRCAIGWWTATPPSCREST